MMTEINNLFSSIAIEPRDYQTRIVRQITDMFAGKHHTKDGALTPSIRSIMVESPTGSGKFADPSAQDNHSPPASPAQAKS